MKVAADVKIVDSNNSEVEVGKVKVVLTYENTTVTKSKPSDSIETYHVHDNSVELAGTSNAISASTFYLEQNGFSPAGTGTTETTTSGNISSNLNDFLTQVTINGQSGNVTVYPGNDLTIDLQFKEEDKINGKQFDPTTGKELTYTLPDGLEIPYPAGSNRFDCTPIDITVQTENRTIFVPNNTWYIANENGKDVIKFKFNSDDDNWQSLKSAANVKFNLSFHAGVSDNVTEIPWNDSAKTKITVDNTHEVNVTKSGSYQAVDNTIIYTLKIATKGKNTKINISDSLKGSALTEIIPGSFKYNNSDINNLTGVTVTPVKSDNKIKGFTCVINELNDSTAYLEYRVKVDIDQIKNNGTGYNTTENDYGWSSYENNNPKSDTSNMENKIHYNPSIQKASALVGSVDDNGYQDVLWTVTYNADNANPVKDATVTDCIGADSLSRMFYDKEGGLCVTKYDLSGNKVSSEDINWNDSRINLISNGSKVTYADSNANKNDSLLKNEGWEFHINDTEPYKYVFTYHTKVYVGDLISSTKVTNTFTDNKGGSSGDTDATVNPGSGNKLDFNKIVNTDRTVDNTKSITWELDITVPANGLKSAVITDTFPNIWEDGKHYYDTLADNGVNVDLQNDEACSVDKIFDNNINTGCKISFPKGLHGSGDASKPRIVKVYVTTNTNEKWIAYAKSHVNDSYSQNHSNYASLVADNVTINKSATSVTSFSKENLYKSCDPNTYSSWDSNVSKSYNYIGYNIRVENPPLDKDLVISDQFDNYNSSIVYDSQCPFYDFDKVKDKNNTEIPELSDAIKKNVRYTPGTGQDKSTITFTIPLSDLKKADSNYVGGSDKVYNIRYYLKIVNEDNLKNVAKHENCIVNNTATFDNITKSASFEYTYSDDKGEIISKTAGNPTGNRNNGTYTSNVSVPYTIVINPNGQELNGGNNLTVTDTYINQSIDLNTITFECDPKENANKCSFNPSGKNILFTIPDSTKVTITYNGIIINSGKNGWVQASNEAKVNGVYKNTTTSVNFSSSGSGSASTCYLYLVKNDADTKQVLSGAKFQLLHVDSSGNEVSPVDGRPTGEEIYFETNDKGFATIQGGTTSKSITWALHPDTQYILREVDPPDGYEKADDLRFTISNNGNSDASNHIYNVGDIINISDSDILNIATISANNDYGECKIADLENATINIDCDCGNVEIGKIRSATIKCDYGNIEIKEIMNKCDIKADCGNIQIDTISIKENSSIKADLGNVDINNTNDIYIDADVDLGKTNINKNNRNASVTLKVNCDCGNVTINN